MLTLAQARTRVRRRLDDESRTAPRWKDAEVDDELRMMASACVVDYAKSGGQYFDEDVTVAATRGVASLAAFSPLVVRGVLVEEGENLYPVQSGSRLMRTTADTGNRVLRVVIVRRPPPPMVDDDLLVGLTSGTMRAPLELDTLIVNRAALQLGVKDDKRRQMLEAGIADLERSVYAHPKTPASYDLRQSNARRMSLLNRLRWVWSERPQEVSLYSVLT